MIREYITISKETALRMLSKARADECAKQNKDILVGNRDSFIRKEIAKEIIRDLELLRIDYGFDTEFLISNYDKGSREYREFKKKWE